MKVTVRKFDFVNERIIEYEREIPNTPPSTPLLDFLSKRAAKSTSHSQEGEQG